MIFLESRADDCYNSPSMKYRIASSLITLAVVVCFFHYTVAAESWEGTYVFDEDGGKTFGGTRILVSHELTLTESDDGYYATLKSNGYQTARDLIGHAKVAGNRLLIYFDSYGEENVFETFRPGDLLLTLERRNTPREEQILTFWGKFLPVVPKNEKTGRVYFVRQEEMKLND